jgi:hypothetical protein
MPGAERRLGIDPVKRSWDPHSREQGLLEALQMAVSRSRQEVSEASTDAEAAAEGSLVSDVEAVMRENGEGSKADHIAARPAGRPRRRLLLRIVAGVRDLLRASVRRDQEARHRASETEHRARATSERLHCFHVLVPCMVAHACTPLPDVRYETDMLEIATEFDHPICAGTLESLDDHVGQVGRSLGVSAANRDPFRVYWMTDGLQEFCREDSRGCFFPGTRVLFARGSSIGHEVVHALLDSGGETFFVEEGMAEVFSGVGALHDAEATPTGLADKLSLSRADYRGRSLDYVAATHFVRWVHETRGFPAMLRLSKDISDDAGGARLRRTLEEIYEESLAAVEARYVVNAPQRYRGLYEDQLPVVDLLAARQGIERDLDCDATHTQGPLWDDRPGMFRAERLVVPRSGEVYLEATGDAPDGWIVVFDPYALPHRSAVTPWRLPEPELDAAAIRLEPGESRTQALERGTYLVVFGSDNPSRPATLGLRVLLARPPGPDTEKPN